MAGLTLDTGALRAWERRRQRALRIIATALRDNMRITVSTAVITEWWRARTDVAEGIIAAIDVEPVDQALARTAGEALAAVPGATAIDAIVMASAARRGDVVYTSDAGDLMKIQKHFPAVRVLAV